MSTQTLLVTGGAGFIGANFILYWMKKHPDDVVRNLDALTYASNKSSLDILESNPNYTFIEGDITDSELVNRVMEGVDTVVHFAAESHVDRSILNPSVFVQTNVLGTHVLLHAAKQHKITRFHHISTDEVFGSLELGSSSKFTEHTPYDPRSPYSASKAGSDHLVRAYGETYGLPYTITNCSNNYGEYQHPEKFIPLAITNLLEGKKIPVYGDGLNVRDWLYVQDHCRAIEQVLLNDVAGQTFVVGGLDRDISNLEVAKLILQLLNKSEDSLEYITDRPGHDRRYSVDWSNLNTKLGWEPSVSFEEGMQKTIDWYQAHQEWWKPLKTESASFFTQNYSR